MDNLYAETVEGQEGQSADESDRGALTLVSALSGIGPRRVELNRDTRHWHVTSPVLKNRALSTEIDD